MTCLTGTLTVLSTGGTKLVHGDATALLSCIRRKWKIVTVAIMQMHLYTPKVLLDLVFVFHFLILLEKIGSWQKVNIHN